MTGQSDQSPVDSRLAPTVESCQLPGQGTKVRQLETTNLQDPETKDRQPQAERGLRRELPIPRVRRQEDDASRRLVAESCRRQLVRWPPRRPSRCQRGPDRVATE